MGVGALDTPHSDLAPRTFSTVSAIFPSSVVSTTLSIVTLVSSCRAASSYLHKDCKFRAPRLVDGSLLGGGRAFEAGLRRPHPFPTASRLLHF